MSRYQPALLGGLFIGVLSSLPIIQSANLCCCLWVVVGGLLTVYLQQQNRTTPVETSEAVVGGLSAGAIGALLNVVVMALLLSGARAGLAIDQQLRVTLDSNPDLPPAVRDTVMRVFSSGLMPVIIAVVTVPTFAVFGMLGALLGVAVFKKKAPPA